MTLHLLAWPVCANPMCEKPALTDDYCRDCAVETYEPETKTVEVEE